MKLIILAGGSGTRLFPLSRTCYPKQFLKIAGRKSLIQQTVERFLGFINQEDILIVTSKEYVSHVLVELKAINLNKIHVIAEPVARNTAPSIALAISYCKDVMKCTENENLIVVPSDHMINGKEKFLETIYNAVNVTKDLTSIVTLGVKPTKPETGYGYIHVGEGNLINGYKVESFKEKPDLSTAKKYVSSGEYFWNSGIFVFSIKAMENELKLYSQKIYEMKKLDYKKNLQIFKEMPNISIDYAIAEQSKNMVVIPMNDIFWNDVGSFDAVNEIIGNNEDNVISGDVLTMDSSNNMILANSRLVTTIGISNLIVVDTPDVLLLCEKGKSQEVKKVVEKLRDSSRKEVNENVTMYRPWGSYTVLSEGDGFKVKKITIEPGEKLSYQMHYHRSEHWTVIHGTGKLTLDDKVIIFKENESTYIPIAVKHRLENPGKIPLSIIEVQNGQYLDEDDIVRFDDVYGRRNS